jgi:ribonuclease HI
MPIIATDGSSLGTPTPEGPRKAEGHGGWAAVIRFEEDHPVAPGFVQEQAADYDRRNRGAWFP